MKVQGRNLKVKAGGVVVACSRSCELSINADMTSIADPQSGAWEKFRVGKKSWSVSVSGLVDVSAGIKPVTNLVGGVVALEFVNGQTSDEKLSGSAIVKSAKVTGTIGNLVQYSCEFQGNGALG